MSTSDPYALSATRERVRDPMYDDFLGEPFQRVYYDWGLRAYVKATMQEPKKPCDRRNVTEKNVPNFLDEIEDVALAPPKPVGMPKQSLEDLQAKEVHQQAKQLIVAYLQEHGPSKISELLPLTPWWKARASIRTHLMLFPDVYVRSEQNTRRWGLVGQDVDYIEPPMGETATRVYDALLGRGALLTSEIERISGVPADRINKIVRTHASHFKYRGTTRGPKGHPMNLWAARPRKEAA